MKRGFILLLFIFLVFLISFSSPVFAVSGNVEDEIKKIVHYAQEYETGNIKFVELLLYESASRQKLNEILGVVSREEGGLLKEEQIRPVLGEPTEETRWIWSEKEEKQRTLDKTVPAWNKIIFDGRKIQIRMEAWPSLFIKNGSEQIIYRLHFSTSFKKPKENFNIQDEIENIKELAETFGAEPSQENAESLAKASVSAEKMFESFYKQSGEKCDPLMAEILGSENKINDQKIFVQEIDFYQGDDFMVNARLEMCDDCQWTWINLHFWIDGRGPGSRQFEEKEFRGEISKKEDDKYYQEKITELINELKTALDEGDYNKAIHLQSQIREVNNAWNEAANNLWEKVERQFNTANQLAVNEGEKGKEGKNDKEDYWWIKEEQRKRKLEKELRNDNYQIRKEFYIGLFKDYNKRESNYKQREYEKRLVELFTSSREVCNNNLDDNQDNKIDCGDSQCGGKVCGRDKKVIQKEGNSTEEIYTDLYCISGECLMKEEYIENQTSCGNHICEAGEAEACAQDCSICQAHEPINCTGKVIFSGESADGCQLSPICISQDLSCQVDSDCSQPLCGSTSCVENQCKVTTLTECRPAECVDGDKRFNKCSSGAKMVSALCEAGVWLEINSSCPSFEPPPISENETIQDNETIQNNNSQTNQTDSNLTSILPGNETEINQTEEIEEIVNESDEIVGNQCVVKEDCGNANDVCSNGICITIPQSIDEEQETENEEEQEVEPENNEGEIEEQKEAPQETSGNRENNNAEDNSESSAPSTPIATSVLNLIKLGLAKAILTGFDIESSDPSSDSSNSGDSGSDSGGASQGSQESQQSENQEDQQQDQTGENEETEQREEQEREREENEREEREDRQREEERKREKEEKERRSTECKDNCQRECYNIKIRPCTDKCIWETCGQDNLADCNIDEAKEKCENTCKAQENLGSCVSDCSNNCIAGKNFGIESKQPEQEEHKEELGVFKAGGVCRKSDSKTEAFIHFDGWGRPFQDLQKIKNKYYNHNEASWCKERLESLKKERKEFEAGFNEEFVKWFFESYMANSADDWESHMSGLFELYWMDVDNARETAMQLDCLGQDKLSESDYNLIKVEYKTEYGKIEFWEEIKKVKMPGMNKEVEIITPYMKTWIFPPKEFLASEMKKSMEEHEFPGPAEEKAERKNEGGPTEEEKAMIKKDKKFMSKIKKMSEKYGGSVDAALQIKDKEKDEVVFNMYVQINEEDIIKMEPMPPSEVPNPDMTMEIDFDKLYDLIYTSEKDMEGQRIESPPWAKKSQPIQKKVKEAVDGIKMWFKIRSLINSAEYSPSETKKDAKSLINAFLPKIMEGDKGKGPDSDKGKEMNKEGEKEGNKGKNQKDKNKIDFDDFDSEEEGIWDSKEKITGEVIAG
ncbi:MAG: hypothetical protein Q8Q31_05310 [Nanoarchaeota archaeon]|nr:hypothetical protein [Nanoarchaeota archaeon]